mgnify:CR=1 FL=1|jgi:hypothetical protein
MGNNRHYERKQGKTKNSVGLQAVGQSPRPDAENVTLPEPTMSFLGRPPWLGDILELCVHWDIQRYQNRSMFSISRCVALRTWRWIPIGHNYEILFPCLGLESPQFLVMGRRIFVWGSCMGAWGNCIAAWGEEGRKAGIPQGPFQIISYVLRTEYRAMVMTGNSCRAIPFCSHNIHNGCFQQLVTEIGI